MPTGSPAPIISELLRVAKRSYDFVVVDTPPAFTEHVLAAFDISDLLVLIATLDIPAVKNLRLTLDTLDLLGSPREDRVVVLNRSDAKVGLKTEDVVTAIKPGDRRHGPEQPVTCRRRSTAVCRSSSTSPSTRSASPCGSSPMSTCGLSRRVSCVDRQKNVAERMTPRVVGS